MMFAPRADFPGAFAKATTAVRVAVSAAARLACNSETLLAPGVEEAKTVDEALDGLGRAAEGPRCPDAALGPG